jgi:hypothetical protein
MVSITTVLDGWFPTTDYKKLNIFTQWEHAKSDWVLVNSHTAQCHGYQTKEPDCCHCSGWQRKFVHLFNLRRDEIFLYV